MKHPKNDSARSPCALQALLQRKPLLGPASSRAQGSTICLRTPKELFKNNNPSITVNNNNNDNNNKEEYFLFFLGGVLEQLVGVWVREAFGAQLRGA